MATTTAPRFMLLDAFEGCLNGARITEQGFDSDGDLAVDQPNDPVTVAAIQQSLLDLGYPVEVTGDYDATTAANVRRFKDDTGLAVPPGLAQHDGVTGRGTSGKLNELFEHEVIDAVASAAPFDIGSRTGTRREPVEGVVLCDFERGLVVQLGHFSGYAVPSRIADVWLSDPSFGPPRSNVFTVDGARQAQDFEAVQILDDGTVVPADVANAAAGAITLGPPLGPAFATGDGGSGRPFERGVVVTTPDGGVFPLPQAVFDEWRAQGGGVGPLGPPNGLGFAGEPGETAFPFAGGLLVLADGAGVLTRPHTPVLGRYFFRAQPETGLRAAAPGTDARFHLGGAVALPEMIADIRKAATGGDGGFVYLANWFCDTTFGVAMPDGTVTTLGDELRAVALAGAQVRALLWDASVLTPLPVLGPALNPLVREIMNVKLPNISVNAAAARAITGQGGDSLAVLDREYQQFGSLHQKVLVVSDGSTVVGWVGGIEWNPDRVVPLSNGAPLFDTAVRLEGPGGAEVLAEFERRWEATTAAGGPLRSRTVPPAAQVPRGSARVQVTTTYGPGKPFPTRITTAAHALTQALYQARTFFYLEDQYLSGNGALGPAMRHALSFGATGVLVICPDEDDDQPGGTAHRRLFLNPLKNDFPDRLLVFERLGPLPARDPAGPQAYVHSKLLLVDDEAALIGSVNANRRGWFHDTEILATVVDDNGPGGTAVGTRGLVRELRCALWASHLGLSTTALGDPVADLGLWFGHAGGPSTLVRPFNHAAPGTTSVLEPVFSTVVDPG